MLKGISVRNLTQMRSSSLSTILKQLRTAGDTWKPSVGEMVNTFGSHGFGPLILIPALILILPTGAIPGMPVICGLLIILITAQIIAGHEHPWIPRWLRRITLKKKTMTKGLDLLEPVAKTIDRHTGPRLLWLISASSKRIAAALCLLLAISVMLIGFIPYAMLLPSLAIAFFGLGFSVNDGLLIAIGFLITAAAVAGGVYWWIS